MFKLKTKLVSCIAASVLFLTAQAQVKYSGSETKVNTTTVNSQQFPSVASDSLGNFTVVWESFDSTNSDWEIHRQFFNNDGSVTGSETELFSADDTDYRYPVVATSKSGVHAVAYMQNVGNADWDAYWRIYDASGGNLNLSRISSSATNLQTSPDAAISPEGDYLVAVCTDMAGDSSNIIARQKNSSYSKTSNSFTVNSTTGLLSTNPKVAVDGDGNFVVVWQQETGDGTKKADIYGQRYDASLNTVGSEFTVNSTTSGNQIEPDVAYSTDGSYIVVWTSEDQDGDGQGVYIQKYDSDGSKNGGEVKINSTTSGDQNHPEITSTFDGYYNITWSSYDQDGDRTGVYYCGLDQYGNKVISEKIINSRTNDFQHFSSVAQGKHDSTAMLVWMDGLRNSSSSHDGDDYGIYMQQIENKDTVDPTAVCQNVTVTLNDEGYATFDSSDVDGGSSDNFVYYTVALSKDSVTCDDLGVSIGTMTVTDLAGNESSCAFAITVNDNTAPNVVTSNVTVYLDASGSATISAADIDGGSTDNCTISTYEASKTEFSCDDLGSNSVTLTVKDESDNEDSATATVTVVDSVAPSLSVQDLTVYLDASGSATVNSVDFVTSSSDNCTLVSTVANDTVYSCDDIGSFNVSITVTDNSGNTKTKTALVTLLDTISPTAVCQDLTVYLDASGSVSVSASDIDNGSTDNCSVNSTTINGSSSASYSCSDLGTNIATLNVTDGSLNSSSCSSTVTVLDTISPTIVGQDLTVYLDGAGNVSITSGDVDNGSSDNCSSLNLSLSESSFTCSDLGANTVTLTGTDGSGNSSSATVTVTVLDTVSPTILGQDLTVYLNESGNATINTADIDNGSSDNCSIVSLSLSQASFTCSNVGSNSIRLVGADGSGNEDSVSVTVTVLDTISPDVVCQNLIVYLDETGSATISASDIDNEASDNCSLSSLTLSKSEFSCSDLGANSVILTATDPSSNSTSCTSTVTVLDTISPAIVGQDLTVYLGSDGTTSITTGDVDNGSTDNCSTVNLDLDQSTFDCSNIGANSVRLLGTDGSGNQDSVTVIVTVVDSVSPTAVCQDYTLYLNAEGSASITASDVNNGSTDNCSVFSYDLSKTTFTCDDLGSNSVTLTVTDVNSNSSTCISTITIIDSVPPTMLAKSMTTYLDASGNVTIAASDLDYGSSDNCGSLSLSLSKSSFTCDNIGGNVIQLIGTDVSGNQDSAAVTVTVLDTVSPVASCQDMTVYLSASGTATITAGDIDNGSTDNCSISTIAIDNNSFTCSDLGVNTVTLTVTDAYSNSSSCISTVTIIDSIRPSMVGQDITVYLGSNGMSTITTGDIDNGSSDNCSSLDLSLSKSTFDCVSVGSNLVRLIGTDGSGNMDSVEVTVSVVDTNKTYVSATICNGETYTFGTQTLTSEGTYTEKFTGTDGCDSTVVLTLNLNPSYDTTYYVTICQGESYQLGEMTMTTTRLSNWLYTSVDGCDSLVTVNLTVLPTYDESVSVTICEGDTYDFGSQTLTTEGTYTETFSAINGCDSVVTLTLDVLPIVTTSLNATICSGETYQFGDQSYSNSGTYSVVYTATNGCDSTVTLTLNVNPSYDTLLNITICEGESYQLGEMTLTTTRVSNWLYASVDGCDSLVTVNLKVLPSFNETASATICEGDNYTLGSQTLTDSGTYSETFTATNGCDSVVTLTLNVLPTASTSLSATICSGESYQFGGQSYTTAGTYYKVYASVNGCDSTVTLTLNVNPSYDTLLNVTICEGESYQLGGMNMTTTRVSNWLFTSNDGCDSLVTVNLTVLPKVYSTEQTSICEGSSYTFGSQTLTSAGTYTETYSATNGCDSIVTLTLNVLPTYDESISATICEGESYTLGSQSLTTAGTYSETFTAVNGCDSIVTLTLNVNSSYDTLLNVTICEGESYQLGQMNMNTTRVSNWLFTSVNGCDSLVTVNLTVLPKIYSTEQATICAGGTYTFGSQTLTTAGTFTETFSSANGCDSIVTLTLNIQQPYDVVQYVTICEGESYQLGQMNMNTTRVSNWLFSSVDGCDSLVTVYLTVRPKYAESVVVAITNGEEYIFGEDTLTTAGSYSKTFTSVYGCDSIVNLTLNVGQNYDTTIYATICPGESYQLGGMNMTTTRVSNWMFTTSDGFDSLVTVYLTVAPEYNHEVSAGICDGTPYTFGDDVLTSAGVYVKTFTSISGCDSIVTLTLNVGESYDTTIYATICEGESYQLGAMNMTTTRVSNWKYTSVNGCDSLVTVYLTVESCPINPQVRIVSSYDTEEYEGDSEDKEVIEGDIKVYPNPTTGVFNVNMLSLDADVNHVIRVFNSIGQLVYQEVFTTSSGKFASNIDIERFRSGLYSIIVYNERYQLEEKIVLRK